MFRISSLALIAFLGFSGAAEARDQIRIVGSSTVYPFVTVVAEKFGKQGKFKTPIVESTGTGGGFKLFCEGTSLDTPDVADASRRIKPEELLACYRTEVKDILEIKIGYDGIVIANSTKGQKFALTQQDIFLALSRKVPAKDNPKKLVDNYYKTWDQVNSKLPKQKIEVYGPPPTSGTRDSFVELAMEAGCWKTDAYVTAYSNIEDRKKACHLIREDGIYIEAGENDNLIVQKLGSNPNALGIFGYSFLKENPTIVQGSSIGGVAPTHDTIANGSYVLARPLYVYIKQAHIKDVAGIKEFIAELVSNDAIGSFGYLEDRGLIPMPEAELKAVQKDALSGKLLSNLVDEKPVAATTAPTSTTAPAAAPANAPASAPKAKK